MKYVCNNIKPSLVSHDLTDHLSLSFIEMVIANCSPLAIMKNFYPAFKFSITINKSKSVA